MKKSILAISALFLSASLFAQSMESRVLTYPVAKAPTPSATDAVQTWKDLGEGIFSDFVLSNLFVGYFNDPVTVKVQESEQNPGMYRVVNPWVNTNENIPFDDDLNYLVIDARDPEFVKVPAQRAPVNDAVDGETWFCSYSHYFEDIYGWDNAEANYGMTKESYKERNADKTPVLKDGVIKFPLNCMALMYPYGSGNEVAPGTWTYTNMEYDGYLVLPGAELDDDWESLGTGKFLEGFLETLFDDSYVPVERDIEIMQNKNVPGVYKLVKAFGFSSPTGRDMIIDARQPDFVRVEEQNTGVNSTNGWIYILSVSTNGPFTNYDEMVAYNPEYAARNITLDEQGIHFPKNSILLYFPTSGDFSVYTNPHATDSHFLFPGLLGVKDVDGDDYDAPAEYFNFQGIRVSRPRPGEPVIVRKGSKTYKVAIP